MAILEVVDNIYEGFDDTVYHEILIGKLNYYSIPGVPLAWLARYLTNRQQYVMINDHISANSKVVCGVPHARFSPWSSSFPYLS